MKYTLIYQRDNETGELGFGVVGTKSIEGGYNMASEGALIAHDLLEHRAIDKIGTIGDELIALGGVWYVRGQHGEIRRDGMGSRWTPAESLAGDVVNMGRDIVLGYKKYHEKVPRLAHCEAIQDLKDIIYYANKDLINELHYDDTEDWTQADLDKYLKDALAFMVKGYNQAKRRFERRLGLYGANNVFWNIAEAVDNALNHADWEGQTFILNINMVRCKASCYEHYEEDNYY